MKSGQVAYFGGLLASDARRKTGQETNKGNSALLLRPFPAIESELLGPGHGELARRHVLGDRRAGTDGRTFADGDRSDENRIGSGVRVITDGGVMFIRTVVVGDDGAGADVDPCADRRIADVSEMVSFGARCHRRVFDLDEVADVDIVRELSARS